MDLERLKQEIIKNIDLSIPIMSKKITDLTLDELKILDYLNDLIIANEKLNKPTKD